MVRCIILFSGRVQGVGFRYTTRQIADRNQLCGWVKNLANGRVECVVEGNESGIRAFLSELQSTISSQTRGQIDQIETNFESTQSPEFSKFEIIR